MERESPAWQPFDPGEPGPGISLPPRAEDGSARVLLLLASEGAARGGWAPRAAASIVRQLASNDGRTLLADLDLGNPGLHEVLGVSNGEGVSDVFLWGASFQRVADAVDPGLLFAPAGTVVADPATVAESPRWDAVLDGFRQARATLAIYVPHDSPAFQRLLDRSSAVVVLATREEAAGLDSAGWTDRVRAVLGPVPTQVGAGGPGERDARPEGAGVGAGPPIGEPSPDWEAEVQRAVAAADPKRFRGATWLALALLVVVAVVVTVWVGWIEVPYLTPLLAGGTETAEQEGVVGPASEPEPEPEPPAGALAEGEPPLQAFSLQLGAYPDAAEALEAARDLSARRPDVLFLVVPVEVNDRIFHRLLAGLAEDPPTMASIRSSLEAILGATNAQQWLVRDAGWAYLLGEFESLAAARGRVGELASGGVQPYVLELSTEEGTVYRVYAGAYANQAEAQALGAMLADGGLIDVPLVQRIGRIPE